MVVQPRLQARVAEDMATDGAHSFMGRRHLLPVFQLIILHAADWTIFVFGETFNWGGHIYCRWGVDSLDGNGDACGDCGSGSGAVASKSGNLCVDGVDEVGAVYGTSTGSDIKVEVGGARRNGGGGERGVGHDLWRTAKIFYRTGVWNGGGDANRVRRQRMEIVELATMISTELKAPLKNDGVGEESLKESSVSRPPGDTIEFSMVETRLK